ncbi:fimbrial protein [Bordetella sp. BOR01]|uniref:fimbrial protein n=1 Tax=Bordetella sp. BOR01 TaxID=2854779 RepID=UPI001C460FDD|nr:fimbrial protein [Bordetella sp. BOR01]MBV7484996.1 type 1 fimbrial protein [Bordetella sp. BOR01]
MKLRTIFIIKQTAASLALAGALPLAAHAASGTVEFEGEIVQSTCDVTGTTKDQTVVIGTYPTSLFQNVGDVSSSKSFTIDMANCEAGAYTVRFDGPNPAAQPGLLAVNEATGVGIEILDQNDRLFPLGQDVTDSAVVTVGAGGSATVNLKARYKSFESTVGAGEANATSTFSIEYR